MSENTITTNPPEITSVRVVGQGDPYDVVMTCEPVSEFFAVTPALGADHSLAGFWTVTHLPTGRVPFWDVYVRGCIGCARKAARLFADSEADIDWGRERESLRYDPAVVAVADRADEVLGACFSLREC